MNKFLIDNFQLTKEEAGILSSSFRFNEYSKGAIFIQNSKVCNEIGFVKKGMLKCETIGRNKEVVDDFIFENQFVTDYHSFLTAEASLKRIECLTSCIIYTIDRSKLEELGREHYFIEQMARKVAEQLYIIKQQKLDDLRLLSAEERYLKLLHSNKRMFNSIPQYLIASYLNVSAETVSRIRKKIVNAS